MPTVIKARESGRLLKRLSTVDLADHLAEARGIIEEAKRRAARITAAAGAEAEKTLAEAKRSGYETGYREGYAEGVEAGQRSAHQEATERFDREQGHLIDAMRNALDEINEVKDGLRIAAENELLGFAVLLATKLTFAVGRLYRESAVENLRRAISAVDSKTDLTVRVHPDDLTAMEEFAGGVLKRDHASRAVRILPDESIAPGGCRVTAGCTEIDAALETQVDEIVSLLLGRNADGA